MVLVKIVRSTIPPSEGVKRIFPVAIITSAASTTSSYQRKDNTAIDEDDPAAHAVVVAEPLGHHYSVYIYIHWHSIHRRQISPVCVDLLLLVSLFGVKRTQIFIHLFIFGPSFGGRRHRAVGGRAVGSGMKFLWWWWWLFFSKRKISLPICISPREPFGMK